MNIAFINQKNCKTIAIIILFINQMIIKLFI